MKKIIIVLIVFSLIFISFFVFKKEEDKANKNISVILETEEGNIESNTFPSNEDYEYLSTKCENTSDLVNVNFDENAWKLNLNVERESIDGKFNCTVHFKEKIKFAQDIIIDKYSVDNNEGLIKINQPATVQTAELVEYRYSGSNEEVKNYVSFNGETWRIIGVFEVEEENGNFEKRLKIMRNESIGAYSWDASAEDVNEGQGANQWGASGSYTNGADLMRVLNPGYESKKYGNSLYYNRGKGSCYYTHVSYDTHISPCDFTKTGLKTETKDFIDKVKWYTAAVNYEKLTSELYKEERGNLVGLSEEDGITRTTSWIGLVGLVNISDYGYSSKDCYEFYSPHEYNTLESCTSSSWMLAHEFEWTITPAAGYATRVIYISENGSIGRNLGYYHDIIRPVVFLKTNVKIISGSGVESDPYILELN